ncbi:MAG: hypothetical protein KJ646_05465 [Nanoarchaeota archaeon]|nr:hypothetical protein [Nanoarchaeota archaeon]
MKITYRRLINEKESKLEQLGKEKIDFNEEFEKKIPEIRNNTEFISEVYKSIEDIIVEKGEKYKGANLAVIEESKIMVPLIEVVNVTYYKGMCVEKPRYCCTCS